MRPYLAQWYDVPHYWPQIEDWIAAALAHGSICWTPGDIRDALVWRKMRLWLALEGDAAKACAVTRLDRGPRALVCTVMLIGGDDMNGWLMFEGDIAKWAADQGADALEGPGRKGWERVVKSKGWVPVWTVYRKMLRDN